MGRRSRHSAKTGDQSLYKNRNNTSTNQDDSDNDPMYDEVDRYNNKLQEEENYLQLDISDKEEDGDSEEEEDDGITTKREGVFDLGMDDDDNSSDDNDGEGDDDGRQTKQKDIKQASSSSSSSSDNSDSEDEEDDKTSKLFNNWGTTKSSYYHGDTADLEIGQSVNDAYLEEEAGREVELARLDELDELDFMLDDDGDHDDDDDGEGDTEEGSEEEMVSSKKRKSKSTAETIETTTLITKKKQTPSSKLSTKKEKLKILKSKHPELLPLLQHFNNPINELNDKTLLACGALLKGGVCKGRKEAEVCYLFIFCLFLSVVSVLCIYFGLVGH